MSTGTSAASANVDALRLVPRAYQEEIFAHAKQENVIAALGTGSGKTLIAAMLVKYFSAQTTIVFEENGQDVQGKKIVFLVPSAPLVEQQRNYLEQQTPLRVRGYAGSTSVGGLDRGFWTQEFKEADVLIMTGSHIFTLSRSATWIDLMFSAFFSADL